MLKLLKSLSRGQKRNIMVAVDTAIIPIALLFAFNLQIDGGAWDVMMSYLPVLPYLLVVAAALSVGLGVSSVQLNAYETSAVGMTGAFALALVVSSFLLATAARVPIAIGTHIVFGITFFVMAVGARAVMLQIVLAIYRRSQNRCRVLIYGAGTTGTQLVQALRGHEAIEPVAFVDDNKALHGIKVAQLPVFSPVRMADLVKDKSIDRVLLALPSLSLPKQAQLARKLQKMGLEVQTLPSFSQLIGEEALVDKLTSIEANQFLNRDEVAERNWDGIESYRGKAILISGAGGSIGSELCRQILEIGPSKLVLFELSELALYKVDQEMRQIMQDTGRAVDLVPVLGSVTDARQVRKVLGDHSIEVVLHAAAYKHVPLVESNPLTGMANNVLGAHTLAQEAAAAGVRRFILVSSDKAVRPTNVMGASKRMAELVLQDLASRVPEGGWPVYATVRFGNVLGSSGSVVPLFQEQLRRGGPVTVTHPEVSRYFMTVQEAVHLVLRAGAMASGGEVYVLDMGKPILIDQLARQVIESAGYTVRDARNPDGDIEIEYTGLRPGEKMTEELTVSGALMGTTHRKIFCTDDAALSEIEIAGALRSLRGALASGDEDAARAVAARYVEGYVRDVSQADSAEDSPKAPERA